MQASLQKKPALPALVCLSLSCHSQAGTLAKAADLGQGVGQDGKIRIEIRILPSQTGINFLESAFKSILLVGQISLTVTQ